MNYLFDKVPLNTEYDSRLRQPITPQLEQSMFSAVPDEQLWELFKNAKDTGYRSPRLQLPNDPLLQRQPEPQQYYEVPPEQQAVQRANAQYANDRYGMQQLGKMGAEAVTMLPQAVSGGLAGGSAMLGAKLGGATWDEALGSYNEASDAAKGVVQEILGQPSQFMELLSTHGFEPVNQYITQKSGDPRLGERLMDLVMMKGGLKGKTGPVAEFGTKAANAGLITGLAATQSPIDLTGTSDVDLNKMALGVMGTIAATESRSPIKQQIFELQKAIRETADPAMKADLGRQIKELQQSKPTQNLPVPVERPLIDPEGPTFQLKSLNAINQLKPEMKINGDQLYKHFKRNGVSDTEVASVFGNLRGKGVSTATEWASLAEQGAPKIGVDIYGGPEYKGPVKDIRNLDNQEIIQAVREGATIVTEDGMEFGPTDVIRLENFFYNHPYDAVDWVNQPLKSGKPAPYKTYFDNEAAKLGGMNDYQVARVNLENHMGRTVLDGSKMSLEELLLPENVAASRPSATREVKGGWKETEHGEITTQNPLGGFITSEAKLPSGEAITVMYEGQPPNIVKEQGRSVEQTAKKLAAVDKFDWSKLSDLDKRSYLRDAEAKKALNPVPEPLAERAMELAAKQMIAQAKESGHAGILLSTGEDVIKRWSSALQGVADEARYNPETQELKLFKNGSPSRAQANIPTKVPPEKLKDYVGGQESADRLLASDKTSSTKFYDETSTRMFGKMYDQLSPEDQTSIKNYVKEYYKERPDLGEHVLTDLSIDKRWPTIEYGQFEDGNYNPGKIAKTLERLTGGDIEMVDVGGKQKLDYDQRYDEVVHQNPEIHKMMSDRKLNKEFINEPSYEGARQYIFEDNEDFMDDARELTDTVYEHIVNNPDSPVAIKLMGESWAGSEGQNKPFLRFTKDTPKTFSIYEWAAMTGLTAAMIQEYLDADDNKKHRMMNKLPALGVLGTIATKGKASDYGFTKIRDKIQKGEPTAYQVHGMNFETKAEALEVAKEVGLTETDIKPLWLGTDRGPVNNNLPLTEMKTPTKSLVADKIRSSAPESQPVMNWVNYLKKQAQRNPAIMKVIQSLSKEKPTAKFDKETIANMLDKQTPQFKTVIGENPLYGGREMFIQQPTAPELWMDQHSYLNERPELSENLVGRIRADDLDNLQDISQIQTSQLAPRELQKAFPEFAATAIKNDALLRGQKEAYVPIGETAEAIQSNSIPNSIKRLYDEMPKLFTDAISERVSKGSIEGGAHIAMQVSKLLDLIWDNPKQELRSDIIDDLYFGVDHAKNWGVDAKEASKLKDVITQAYIDNKPITINYLIRNGINESTFDIALREGLFRNPRFKKKGVYNKIDFSRSDLTPYLYGAIPLLVGDEDLPR